MMERERRVVLLAVAIGLMGLSDLLCTMAYMSQAGLLELNPLARIIAVEFGAIGLTVFKVASIALCLSILCALRRRRQAETCAWISAACMLALTAHWVHFNAQAPGMTTLFTELAAAAPAEWVRFSN